MTKNELKLKNTALDVKIAICPICNDFKLITIGNVRRALSRARACNGRCA